VLYCTRLIKFFALKFLNQINTGQADGTPGLDLNVAEAWELGYTGKGVTIGIMDDGIDYLHPDLASNYNAEASYDFSGNDPYPYPRYTDDWFNSHGTRCAGEVSAAANNNICGVGVAYNSKVAGKLSAGPCARKPSALVSSLGRWGGKNSHWSRAGTSRLSKRGEKNNSFNLSGSINTVSFFFYSSVL